MLLSFALSTIENTFNYYLQLDPESGKRLSRLSEKTIVLQSKHFHYQIYFIVRNNKIHLTHRSDNVPDVTLMGTPFDFLRLSSQSDSASVFASEIEITGDIETAEHFKSVFAELEIDWEEQLSKVTGDMFAHQVGNFIRSISHWAKQSVSSLRQDLTEYIQEEVKLVPSRAELQDFFNEIDDLHHDMERMEKRVERLHKLNVASISEAHRGN